MLLTCDAGNTNIKLAIFDGFERKAFVILETKPCEFKSLIMTFLYKSSVREDNIDDCVLASVVPSITKDIISAIQDVFHKNPIVISHNNYCGIKISNEISDEVGADLLVMSAYAYSRYQKEMLVVSLGTATVISHITNDGTFTHCIIAPGFLAMANSLYNTTDMLPDVSVRKHDSLLVSNTIDAINVGVMDGYIGMVNYLIEEVKKELNSEPIIVGCGGVGKDASAYIHFDSYNPDLVTEGLDYLYMRYFNENNSSK